MFKRVISYHTIEKHNTGIIRGLILASSLMICAITLAMIAAMVL